jgi:ureidoglycolate lyase
MTETLQIVNVPVIQATRENIADYGLFIGAELPEAGLSIPFYKGSVEEGYNIPFEYNGKAVVRTARISKRSGDIVWLERHMDMTQLFVGLGDQPLAMVLGKPNHPGAKGGPEAAELSGLLGTVDGKPAAQDVPDLDQVKCFLIPPGHGVMIWKGTWHDFPMCVKDPVTVLTANSEEVVAALASQKTPDEMNSGDVYKIDIKKRTGKILRVNL